MNLAYGWCAITALGDFHPTAGGHLVLPDLKLAVEFPPGSTILIPSAIFTHYNLPIGPDETRRSITLFSAGSIFRWISYKFQPKGIAVAGGVDGEHWWESKEGLYTCWPRSTEQAEKEDPDTEGGCSEW